MAPCMAKQVYFIGYHTGSPNEREGKIERKPEGGERTSDGREP